MSFLPRHFPQPPFATALPQPLYFRTACMPAEAAYPNHRHPWGEFVYSYTGVMEVRVGDRQYLVPSQYGLWLPPDVEHQGLNRYEACHSSLYVSGPLCARLPETPCALEVSPLVRALLEHLRAVPPQVPDRPEDVRLLEVLVDQLTQARSVGSYLPTSTDPVLAPVLAALEADPGDPRPVADLARQAGTTERTLTRRCLRDLGMPLSEWRQRLRVVAAMTRLDSGRKVEAIARDLGYSSPSAFIAMFRRLTGTSPDEYRRRNSRA